MGKILKRLFIAFILLVTMLLHSTSTVYADTEDYSSQDFFKNNGSVMLTIEVETGQIKYANIAAASFYGYSIEELKSMTIKQINTLSEDELKIEREMAASQKRNYFIFKHKLKDGTIRDVEVYSYPYTNDRGEQLLYSIIHDITAKVKAEKWAIQSKLIIIALLVMLLLVLSTVLLFVNRSKKKAKISHNRLKRLFDNMQEGFALHEIICDISGNPVDYKFIDVNKSFENITGLKGEVIKNRTVKEILPGTEKYWIEKYGIVALTGEPTSFTNYSKDVGKHFSVSVYSPEKMQFITMFTDITEQVLAKEKINLEKHLLESILEDTLSGFWDWNLENDTEYYSPSYKKMFGYEDDELENIPDTWKKLIFKEDLPKMIDLLEQHFKSHGSVSFYNEVRYHHKDGSTVWAICSGRVVEWGFDNRPLRMVGCHIDITSLKQTEKALREETTLFQTTLHSIGDGVISTDKNGKIYMMNAVAEKLTGWSSSEAKGVHFDDVFKIINEFTREKCESPVMKVFETGEIVELGNHTLLIKKNGEELPIEDSAAPITDEKSNINGVVIVFRDYTEKKEKQDKIIYLSYHDQLTGLYNRRFFEEELNRLDTERNLPFTIAMVDVNGLKLTNDAFGHLQGDELLKRVAEILKKECRSDDIVARVGGDEFVIILPKTTDKETEKIIKRIYRAVGEEQLGSIVISVSIGWDTKMSIDQLIRDVYIKAEEHMYRKKLSESQSMRNQTVQVILKTLNEKNAREKIHSEKVSLISRKIGEAMDLDYDTLKEIEISGLMHDIGKIAINENLLNKPGKLTKFEYEEIKRHPEISYQILKSLDTYSSLAEYVLSHHERWDGKGYPRGLEGEEIPLISRIIAIADSYEAMVSDRSYKKAMSNDQAINELKNNSGTQFDPNIVKIFEENFHEIIN